jgi:hypothetical protein
MPSTSRTPLAFNAKLFATMNLSSLIGMEAQTLQVASPMRELLTSKGISTGHLSSSSS